MNPIVSDRVACPHTVTRQPQPGVVLETPNLAEIERDTAVLIAIHDVLGQHPSVYLPLTKELHFFDDDSCYARGRDWYESNFAEARAGQVAGEATPAYMSYETTPQRILETLGVGVKLIFSLREPVARAYSEFLHNRRRGFIEGNFEDAIQWEFDSPDRPVWERRKDSQGR